MKKPISYILLFIGLTILSCGEIVLEAVTPYPDIEDQGTLEDYINQSIEFGLNLFADVNADGDENVLFSPYSLQTALSIAMNGAANETLEEFRTVLNTGDFYPPSLNKQAETIAEMLRPNSNNTTFQSSNALFYDPSKFIPNEDYIETIEMTYDTEIIAESLSNPSTVTKVNDWIAEKTEGRVNKVIEEIDHSEVILILNALIITGQWESGFSLLPESSPDRLFTTSANETVFTPTMYSHTYRDFTSSDEYVSVDLNFKDSDYSLTLIQPSTGLNINDFIRRFDINQYKDLYNSLSKANIKIHLPKFQINQNINMEDILIERGLTKAFQSADLRRMGEFEGSTKLSKVIQDAYIKVDEKGVEGAAVSQIGVTLISNPSPLKFNRPFIFIVRHVETNLPIFIGKVGNPLK